MEKPGVVSTLNLSVIGAGLAGLRCADILLQHGFRVTLIEGRDRLGGRVAQERLPNGHLVDLGPNWIHGTDDNPILDLAKATGTAVGTWDESSHVFDENGNLFARQESERYSQIMWKMIQEAFEYSNTRCPDVPAEESLLDFFRRKLPEHIPDTESDHLKDRAFVLQLAESWGAFVGSPVSTQSLRFFWLEECIDGETLFCADTYRWLKKNLDAFHPSLPDRLQQGIAAIGYGCLEKVYISFPQPFWLTPDKTGRFLQGFCQWLAPKYALESNPTRWSQETVELASPSLGTSHPTLLFYIFGNESRFITQQVSSLGTKQERDDFLRSFFKPYYSRLPQYDESSADCLPTAFLSTDWLHDDLAGNGSYCNFQTGLGRGDDDIRAMREGLPEGGLWFAGEHTAPFVALGTATGAYWSGENVGRRIAEMHGRGPRA
ncbi:Ribosome biogenesis protein nsa2 [Verticillium dahliae VDG1]|nr:Ribosome biogenesis protein nsa2 [Verticillium dahliae VDG1]